MEDFEKRLIEEFKELKKKWVKLTRFIGCTVYMGLEIEERERLSRQLVYMQGYLYVLEERLRARDLLQYTGRIREINK